MRSISRTYHIYIRDSRPAPFVQVGTDHLDSLGIDTLAVTSSVQNQYFRLATWRTSGDGHFLDSIAPNDPCVIGGDFNTKALPRGENERHLLLDSPERYEPLFADLRAAGFEWRHANLALPTQAPGPSNKHEPPFGKLDWVVVRGLEARAPQVVPAVDEAGRAVSDHEMIVVDLTFPDAQP